MYNSKKKTNKIKYKSRILIIFTILSVISLLLLITSGSYAFLMSTKSSNSQDMYKIGDLNVIFNESNIINLTNQYPMNDNAGMETTPHTFTISNNGNYNVNYIINIKDSNWSSSKFYPYVKYQLNASAPKTISPNNQIDVGTLIPGEKKVFELRMWIDNSATSKVANMSYNCKIDVSGQAVRIPYFKDNSGANEPKLPTGFIPVVYDGVNDTWMVADKSKGWYNYSDQVWANAITTNDVSYRTASAGTPIPMSSINSMWVWIPRYKYRIPSNIGSSSNVASPPQIDVVFESGVNTTGETLSNCPINYTNCYYTHPAFRNGASVYKSTAYDQGGWDKELSGIWVGKFETGGTSDVPLIKPDINSLMNQNISSQFQISLKFAGGTMNSSTGAVTFSGNSTYGLTSSTDTHMMKNTEWGSVAYLSQSKYGKDGNSNYTGTNKGIYINNSSSLYTGRSGGSPSSGSTTYGSYSYNGKRGCSSSGCTTAKTSSTFLLGTGASTTGTIYGVYDMVGGSNESTMSNLRKIAAISGFNVFPNSKYYDLYLTSDDSQTTISAEKSIKGDAIYETSRWRSNDTYFTSSTYPWGTHGGSSNHGPNASIFYSGATGGGPASTSFRTVLIY